MPTSRHGSLLGAARPRVELRPPGIAYSLGGEAVELAGRTGLKLDPWQVSGLELMLSVKANHRWACYEYAEIVGRQTGKTKGLLAPRALAGFFLLGERLIMWSAHEYKTAMESFLQMRELIGNLGEVVGARDNIIDVDGVLIKVNSTNGEEEFLRLDTRQRIKFLARSKGSGRGFTGDANLVDEAFALTRAQQSASGPTTLAVPNAQMVYTSTPPLDGDSGEVLFSLRERAESGEDEDSLGYRDWGLEGDLTQLAAMAPDERRALLTDRRNWVAAIPALGHGRVAEESIERIRKTMAELDFGREILCIWPVPASAGGRVIPVDAWGALADADSQIAGPMVFAIDANPERTRASINVGGSRDDGRRHVEVVESGSGLGWVVERAQELDEKWTPAAWVLDPASAAGGLLQDLKKVGIEPELVTGREFAQACGAFYDDVIAGKLRHLGQPELDAAVEAARKRYVADAWSWDRKDPDSSITELVGATLARHGAEEFGADPLENIY